jgi:hypothetical protein
MIRYSLACFESDPLPKNVCFDVVLMELTV